MLCVAMYRQWIIYGVVWLSTTRVEFTTSANEPCFYNKGWRALVIDEDADES